jgi:hypothetical protein
LQPVFGETAICVLQTASTSNRFAVRFSVFKLLRVKVLFVLSKQLQPSVKVQFALLFQKMFV